MSAYINKTSRAIAVGGTLLGPGKECKLDDINKLKELYPRFAELLDKGDVVEATKAVTAPVAASEAVQEATAVESKGEVSKPVSRRKRV